MNDRDCENCKHHTEKGCDSWDCNFEQGMKRKEIIEMLKVLKNQALKSHNDTAIIDVKKDSFIYVMNTAINSLEIDERYELEYEQIEPCEDAISRQAVLDCFNNKVTLPYDMDTGLLRVYLQAVVDAITKLPSVNPQPKTGHWIEHPEIETSTPEYLMFYECSECGDKQCFCKSDIHKKRFCNNCGAKMVEPQESEE